MSELILKTKSRSFAAKIVKLYKKLLIEKNEYVLSKQILRCGTSIGSNIAEAIREHTKEDFYRKISLSLKASVETEFWLELLHETFFLEEQDFMDLFLENRELMKMLDSVLQVKTKQTPPLRKSLYKGMPNSLVS